MTTNIKNGFIGDDSKDISRGIRIKVELQASLPFMSLSQSTGPGAIVTDVPGPNAEYNCGVAKMAIVKNPRKNLLVDENDPNRYTFIGVMASYTQSIEMDIYHDSVDGDMFCIPSLVDVGDTALTKDLMKNRRVNVVGYGLGVSGDIEISSKGVAPYNHVRLTGKPNEIESSLHILRIPGKYSANADAQGFMLNGGNLYIENTRSVPSEFVSIGSTATLGVKVPVYRYIRTSIGFMHAYYVGEVDIDDIIIPMTL